MQFNNAKFRQQQQDIVWATYRCWTSQGARYVGFLGQSRPLTYNRRTTRGPASPSDATSPGPAVLPPDITEGPKPPMESTGGRHMEQPRAQNRLQYPLVFDNSRWIRLTRSAASRTRASADESHDIANKNKFFEALVKPCVSIAVDVYT